jgi:uncharacterized protein (DUF58 family)
MGSKLTHTSWVFIVLTIFTVSVAAYFNHPLLVYTAVFMVVSNIVLFIWAQTAVRTLTIKRTLPQFAVATQPLDVTVRLENHGQAPRFGVLGFDLHSRLTPGKEYSPVAFLELPPGQPVEASYRITPARRGEFRLGPFYLNGGDPFGFYKCWNKVESYSEVLVLPCPVGFKASQPQSISELMREELGTVPLSGNSTEFLGVREYVQGEPPKRIHWRTSARLGKLISRQYEMNVAAAVSVLLLADDSMNIGTAVDNPLEYSITMIASLAFATISEPYQFNYLGILGDRHEHQKGTGQALYRELAIRLAKTQSMGGKLDWERARRLIVNHLPQDSTLIVFTGDVSAAAQERLNRLAVHFRQVTVISFDRASFERGQRQDGRPAVTLGRGFRIVSVGYQSDLKQALAQVFVRRRPRAQEAS